MTASDDTKLKAHEFIADAQDIIAKTNDLMAALNRLLAKNGNDTVTDPKKLAEHARLEEELAALVQRYMPGTASLPATQGDAGMATTSRSDAAISPGRFRPRI